MRGWKIHKFSHCVNVEKRDKRKTMTLKVKLGNREKKCIFQLLISKNWTLCTPNFPYLLCRCNLSFVFDPAGRLCYYWSMVVSFAFLYNFWVIIFRFSFAEITGDTLLIWFSLDYLMDLIYLLDIIFHFRTGYLEDGVLQVCTQCGKKVFLF